MVLRQIFLAEVLQRATGAGSCRAVYGDASQACHGTAQRVDVSDFLQGAGDRGLDLRAIQQLAAEVHLVPDVGHRAVEEHGRAAVLELV